MPDTMERPQVSQDKAPVRTPQRIESAGNLTIAGAATGAALGALGGPEGAIAGAIIGAIIGLLLGGRQPQ
jgi:uncharacterized membrane protein